MDPNLLRFLMIPGAGGVIGSLIELVVALFGSKEGGLRVENATGIGFLVGTSLGALARCLLDDVGSIRFRSKF